MLESCVVGFAGAVALGRAGRRRVLGTKRTADVCCGVDGGEGAALLVLLTGLGSEVSLPLGGVFAAALALMLHLLQALEEILTRCDDKPECCKARPIFDVHA